MLLLVVVAFTLEVNLPLFFPFPFSIFFFLSGKRKGREKGNEKLKENWKGKRNWIKNHARHFSNAFPLLLFFFGKWENFCFISGFNVTTIFHHSRHRTHLHHRDVIIIIVTYTYSNETTYFIGGTWSFRQDRRGGRGRRWKLNFLILIKYDRVRVCVRERER